MQRKYVKQRTHMLAGSFQLSNQACAKYATSMGPYEAAAPVRTSYNPSPCLRESRSLQNRIIGSHSVLEAGIRPPGGARCTRTTEYPFSTAVCVGPKVRTGVGHREERVVGKDSMGPDTETMEASPRGNDGSPEVWDAVSSEAEVCVRHQCSPNSRATVPP
jgi:hypothetical protein